MIKIAEHLPPKRTLLWDLCRQVGVTHAVGQLPYGQYVQGQPWEFHALQVTKQLYEQAGFTLSVIEHFPPIQRICMGLDGRDEEIEWFRTFLRAMGKLDIPVVCWNFMTSVGWLRTSYSTPGRGGSTVTSFDEKLLANAPDVAVRLTHEQLWDNIGYFLERVLPVAEEANVKMALHPDDPPLDNVLGTARIMTSVDAFQKVLDLYPSPSNGITLCQGNFALMTDDLPAVIRKFGEQDKIFFVHLRDVRGTVTKFEETFHDEGQTDMLACFQAYKDVGYDGCIRSDHVPTLAGETPESAGYGTLGRLFAVGYFKGLLESVYGREALRASIADDTVGLVNA